LASLAAPAWVLAALFAAFAPITELATVPTATAPAILKPALMITLPNLFLIKKFY
jgi:hypothetical protein